MGRCTLVYGPRASIAVSGDMGCRVSALYGVTAMAIDRSARRYSNSGALRGSVGGSHTCQPARCSATATTGATWALCTLTPRAPPRSTTTTSRGASAS
jgi:hypothetical protein